MSNLDEKSLPLIPEFFHELIARIIPGMVAIVSTIWATGNLSTALANSKEPLTESFLFLVASWVVGSVLDIGILALYDQADALAHRVLPEGVMKVFKAALHRPSPQTPKTNEWWIIRELSPWERGVIMKTVAQRTLFRSLSATCALVTLTCLVMECALGPQLHLPVLYDHHRRYAIATGALLWVLVSAWRVLRRDIVNWTSDHQHHCSPETSRSGLTTQSPPSPGPLPASAPDPLPPSPAFAIPPAPTARHECLEPDGLRASLGDRAGIT
jgi:hypothetical protein